MYAEDDTFYDNEHGTISDERRRELDRIIEDGNDSVFTDFIKEKLYNEQGKNWDKFFLKNQDRFFRDRNYLDREFVSRYESYFKGLALTEKVIRYFDAGCGVGNTAVPLTKLLNDKYGFSVELYGFDVSKNAIKILTNRLMSMKDAGSLNFFTNIYVGVWDLIKSSEPACVDSLLELSSDLSSQPKAINETFRNYHLITLIFVLSAILFEDQPKLFKILYDRMDTGGLLYIRDYSRYDYKQQLFAADGKSTISDNCYVRTDGTFSSFISIDQLRELCEQVGFKILELREIVRIMTNRKTQVKFERVFIQAVVSK